MSSRANFKTFLNGPFRNSGTDFMIEPRSLKMLIGSTSSKNCNAALNLNALPPPPPLVQLSLHSRLLARTFLIRICSTRKFDLLRPLRQWFPIRLPVDGFSVLFWPITVVPGDVDLQNARLTCWCFEHMNRDPSVQIAWIPQNFPKMLGLSISLQNPASLHPKR